GILLAILIYTTVAEPRRGASDAVPGAPLPEAAPEQAEPEQLTLAESLREIGSRPAAVHLLFGVLLTAAAISSYSTWSVSFLMRQHDMALTQAGLTVGITMGVLGSVGGLLFGVLADRATRRDGAGNP